MPFSAGEIEDGTGLPDAIVYEDVDAAAAWLERRGKTAFSAASATDQEKALITATEKAEYEMRRYVRGLPLTTGQGLLFPAVGAYDDVGRLMDADEIPRRYVEGIRLLAETVADGTFLTTVASIPVGISSESVQGGSISYNTEFAGSVSIQHNHPEIWQRLATAIPKM